ncbi:hypothetical protein J6590_048664 [Homalodisca vitripennis]|nr:hypothetical protein J6590_048664 [Homalodisca vitripennis]
MIDFSPVVLSVRCECVTVTRLLVQCEACVTVCCVAWTLSSCGPGAGAEAALAALTESSTIGQRSAGHTPRGGSVHYRFRAVYTPVSCPVGAGVGLLANLVPYRFCITLSIYYPVEILPMQLQKYEVLDKLEKTLHQEYSHQLPLSKFK